METKTKNENCIFGISKPKLRNFAKHVILAEKKLSEMKRKKEVPAFLFKRKFPGIQITQPQPAVKREVKEVKEIKPEVKAVEIKPEEIFEIGKLTKFTIDPAIEFIECPGRNFPVKIKKETYTFQTDMILKEDEIMNIIKIFSKDSGVPIAPIFRAESRGFRITAIITSTGARFLIARKK